MSTMNPETMTVDQLAETLGLQRTDINGWHQWCDDTGVVAEPRIILNPDGEWYSWPKGDSDRGKEKHISERTALLHLYHLATAPTQAGNNVALVTRALRAWQAWQLTNDTSVKIVDATARAFGEMLAEAFVADEKEGA